MIRIVADTNIIVSSYEFGGNPGRVIDKALTGNIEMTISQPIMDELWRVLGGKFGWPKERLQVRFCYRRLRGEGNANADAECYQGRPQR